MEFAKPGDVLAKLHYALVGCPLSVSNQLIKHKTVFTEAVINNR